MTILEALVDSNKRIGRHAPWPRVIVSPDGWRDAVTALADGQITLAGFWGDAGQVHLALLDEADPGLVVATLSLENGGFPSVALSHPPAQRLERAIADLWGHCPVDTPDSRPWLDHGLWPASRPMSAARTAHPGEWVRGRPAPYGFLPVIGESLHQIPVGPVHAGIIEPGHFRFTAQGETVVRLEARLGYAHRGIEAEMTGSDLARATKLAARACGDSTVAYAYAFANAAEAAIEVTPSPRAVALRGVMAELERLANHLGDVGAICNDAAFAVMLAQFGALRERVLRSAKACFGHRLMMDRIVPGGVTADLDEAGAEILLALCADLRAALPPLIRLYDGSASLEDRVVGTGHLASDLARRFGAGGYVGRASGRAFDARRVLPYAPYERLNFNVPTRVEGDVDARIWIRLDEINESIGLIEQLLAALPEGPIFAV
ncbi:MAG: hydrogenase expression protein HypE, partial [Rhodospirillaceae bacterium]|nr:hydrogenase expression protein HypE [Rhodospirillaceae bacterium]